MTAASAPTRCVVCGGTGSVTIDPPRRTLARGPDAEDPSLSVIGVLPDVVLCQAHADEVDGHHLMIGWCDDERCRIFGQAGTSSPCGEPFKELKH